MFCESCHREIECRLSFRPFYGCANNIHPTSDQGVASSTPGNLNEEQAIRYYFNCGFEYNVILQFLSKYHGVTLSLRTLSHRLKEYGLTRRHAPGEIDEARVAHLIRQELNGDGCLLGYRAMWRLLKRKYQVKVSRRVVRRLLRVIDPDGSNERRSHRLKRREYSNPGPNFCWHADGYDKLKPYGFPIHGCIDGYSRRVLWLAVGKSNNDPKIISKYFLQCVEHNQGYLTMVRTDRGTENTLMAAMQCFLRRSHGDDHASLKAHIYGPSTSNQRIEAWWSHLRKSWTTWWMNFFSQMVDAGELDTSDELQKHCLWFCFNKLVQKGLNQTRISWNTHYIRKSRHNTHAGIPDEMYFLPENFRAHDCKFVIDNEDTATMKSQLDDELSNNFDEYFSEISRELNLPDQSEWTWNEAQGYYHQLLEIAR